MDKYKRIQMARPRWAIAVQRLQGVELNLNKIKVHTHSWNPDPEICLSLSSLSLSLCICVVYAVCRILIWLRLKYMKT